ncbi:MAG: aspartate/glutamate racemase family protein [Chloroflexota bacterium]|nr:aspartate/glutamate racemase family protein [Chloroflexota bacterium]
MIARERDRYEAFVIACFGDPGLAASRELVDVPVIGIAGAAIHLSCLVAHQFSIVSVLPRVKPMLLDLVRRYGLTDRCASIRTTGLGVLEIEQDWDRAERLMIAEAQAAIDEDGAEAICLGCAGMGPLQERMQAKVSVPVLDGTGAVIKLAESLHDLGIHTAKVRAFQDPEPKEYVGDEFPFVRRLSARITVG